MMDRMCHSHANEQPGRFCVCPSRRVCSGSSRFFRLCLGNGRKNIRSLHDGAHQSENPDAVRRVCQAWNLSGVTGNKYLKILLNIIIKLNIDI